VGQSDLHMSRLAIDVPENVSHDLLPLCNANFPDFFVKTGFSHSLNLRKDDAALNFETILCGLSNNQVWLWFRCQVVR